MRSLVLCILLCVSAPVVASAQVGDEEQKLIQEGWEYCRDVLVLDFDPKTARGSVTISVTLKNVSSSTKDVKILAGYIDSVSKKIGWASGTAFTEIDGSTKKRVLVESRGAPLSRNIGAKTFCR